MDKSIQLSSFQNQISSKQGSVTSLQLDNDALYGQRETCISNIQQLEQELVELLANNKILVQEFNHMEGLTSGDASPMGRIQFVKSGVLEGTALQSIQENIIERRQNQKDTLAKIDESIQTFKTKSIEIEEDIEQEKKQLLTIDSSISNNQQRIHQLRAEITSVEGQIRTFT